MSVMAMLRQLTHPIKYVQSHVGASEAATMGGPAYRICTFAATLWSHPVADRPSTTLSRQEDRDEDS
jgi:hypothetical protein